MKQKTRTQKFQQKNEINDNFNSNDLLKFKEIAKQKGYIKGAKISLIKDDGDLRTGIIDGDIYYAEGSKCFSVSTDAGYSPLYFNGKFAKIVKTKEEMYKLFQSIFEIESTSIAIDELKSQVLTLQKQKGGYIKHNNSYRKLIDELSEALKIQHEEIQKGSQMINDLRIEKADFNSEINSYKRIIERQKQQIQALVSSCEKVEAHANIMSNTCGNYSVELQLIKSSFWYRLFTWSWKNEVQSK